jgi:putative ABC transport system permease protein
MLVLKNLGRNKVRTSLTSLAVVVLTVICVFVTAVIFKIHESVRQDASQTKLIVTERWAIPSRIPVRYVEEIVRSPEVTSWTTWNWHPGFLKESRSVDSVGFGCATRVETLREMHVGLESLPDSLIEALKREKTGCIVGANVMSNMRWRVGQEFTLLSLTPTEPDLRFKILGAMPPGKWGFIIFFRDDYYREGTGRKDSVDNILLRVRDPEAGKRVAAKIQRDFENRQPNLKVETEAAGVARLAEQARAIQNIIQLVAVVLLVDMMIILSNSISIATRERRTEMAVLKVLGFKPMGIFAMVVGEATAIGALSGLIGAGLAYGASELAGRHLLPVHASTSFLLTFPIPVEMLALGPALGALVGGVGSAVPAWSARNVKVSDVFAKIA